MTRERLPVPTRTTTMIINSRFVPYLEQKNSRTFQGLHISHFSRIPFKAKKSLEYVSFLVLPQHEQFYPQGLSVLAPCRYLRIRVGQLQFSKTFKARANPVIKTVPDSSTPLGKRSKVFINTQKDYDQDVALTNTTNCVTVARIQRHPISSRKLH